MKFENNDYLLITPRTNDKMNYKLFLLNYKVLIQIDKKRMKQKLK